LVSGAVLDGISAELAASGADIGAAEQPPPSLPEPDSQAEHAHA
jgi:hypothetical protein